jgi:Ca2+-binding EF-hand superfamily protein
MSRTLLPLPLTFLAILTLSPLYAKEERLPASPGPAIVKKLTASFIRIDLNGDGRINSGEWRQQISGRGRSSESTIKLFRSADTNRNRQISFREYAAFKGYRLPAGTVPPRDGAKRSFRRLDLDRDELLSISEIEAIGRFASEDAVIAYFTNIDSDDSGGITLQEWSESLSGRSPHPRPIPSFSRYLGLTFEAAIDLAGSENRRYRVATEDGVDFFLTKDYVPERVNFTLISGVVTGARGY